MKYLIILSFALTTLLTTWRCDPPKEDPPKELTSIEDMFGDIDSLRPGEAKVLALKVIPYDAFVHQTKDTTARKGFALVSQDRYPNDSTGSFESIVTDEVLLSWLRDSITGGGGSQTLTWSDDTLIISGGNSIVITGFADSTLTVDTLVAHLTRFASNEVLIQRNIDSVGIHRVEISSLNNYRQYSVASRTEIYQVEFPINSIVTSKENAARYKIEASAVSGYTTDSIAVIPTGSNYAILMPNSGGFVNADWFGASGDGLDDDTEELNKMTNFAGRRGLNMELTSGKTYKVKRYLAKDACVFITGRNSYSVFDGNNAIIQSRDITAVNAIVRGEISTAIGDTTPLKSFTIQNLIVRGNILNTAGVGGSSGIHFYVPDMQRYMAFVDDLKIHNVRITNTSSGIIGDVRSSNLSNIQVDSVISHGFGFYKRGFQNQGAYGDVDSLAQVAGTYTCNITNFSALNSISKDFFGYGNGGFGMDFSGNSVPPTNYRDAFVYNVSNVQIVNYDRGIKIQGWVAVNIDNVFMKNITSNTTTIWANEEFKSFILSNVRVENADGPFIQINQIAEQFSITNLVARNVGQGAGHSNAIITIAQVKNVTFDNISIIQDSLNTTLTDKNLLLVVPPLRSIYTLKNMYFENFGRNLSRLLSANAEGTAVYENCTWRNCFGIDALGSMYVQGLDSSVLIMNNCNIIMDSVPLFAGGDDVFSFLGPMKKAELNNVNIFSSGVHMTDFSSNGAAHVMVMNSPSINAFQSGVADGEIMMVGDHYLWYSDSLSRWLNSTTWPTTHAMGSAISPLPAKVTATSGLATAGQTLDPKITFEPTSTAIVTGNSLGSIDWVSADASTNSAGVAGRIELLANASFSGNANTNMIFRTNNSVAGGLLEAMRITNLREVNINGSTDQGDYNLQVTGNVWISGKIRLGGIDIINGTGSPEGSVTAPVGSMYMRSDGGASTSLYVKESGAGNTGWIAK